MAVGIAVLDGRPRGFLLSGNREWVGFFNASQLPPPFQTYVVMRAFSNTLCFFFSVFFSYFFFSFWYAVFKCGFTGSAELGLVGFWMCGRSLDLIVFLGLLSQKLDADSIRRPTIADGYRYRVLPTSAMRYPARVLAQKALSSISSTSALAALSVIGTLEIHLKLFNCFKLSAL